MKKYLTYIIAIVTLFAAFVGVFNFFPRSEYSELERRELTKRPAFSFRALTSGEYTKAVSSWYSDTEPFRDLFMTISMEVRKARELNLRGTDNHVTFIAAEQDPELTLSEPSEDMVAPVNSILPKDSVAPSTSVPDPNPDLDERAKITNNGIFIVGKTPEVRAMMAYLGKGGGKNYAAVVNLYKETFPDVNIFCMIIPTAVEYYCPPRAKTATFPETATIDTLYAHLRPDVLPVPLWQVMASHADEPIYLRTDHHWSPLGAFYAAQQFCRVAGVHVPQLSEFEQHVTHRFVGSMYGFSQDISVKHSPEDFVYYTPLGVTYNTTYIVYDVDSLYQVVGEHRPYQGEFFHHFRDGDSRAYCTFMGGDTKIAKVQTSTRNGRRVLILKDSFGNALPGYLFGSFEEVHVVDGRYFTKNMVDYVSQNAITDIVFANNVFKAYAGGRQYRRFLTQQGTRTYTPRVTAPAPQPDTLSVASSGTVFVQDSLRVSANDTLRADSHDTLTVKNNKLNME